MRSKRNNNPSKSKLTKVSGQREVGVASRRIQDLRRSLLEEREQIVQRLELLQGSSQAALNCLESDLVTQIDHAMKRLDDGCYGTCENCAAAISEVRLQALPFASLCRACKEQEEQEG